jgi:hypothetical protein
MTIRNEIINPQSISATLPIFIKRVTSSHTEYCQEEGWFVKTSEGNSFVFEYLFGDGFVYFDVNRIVYDNLQIQFIGSCKDDDSFKYLTATINEMDLESLKNLQ